MSDKYGLTTQEVVSAVKQMIANKYKISSVCYNSLYLYTHDNIPVVTLSEYCDIDNGKNNKYSLQLDGIPDVYSIKVDNDFYKELILSMGRQYECVVSNKTPRSRLNMKDVIDYYQSKKHLGEKDAALLLISYMIKHRCPIDVINRMFYLFDKPGTKTVSDLMLHKNRIVQYDSSKNKNWFFVGEAGSRSFSEFDKKSQGLFDFVEKTYQKQHN